MNWFSQVFAVSMMNLRNVPQRLGASLVIVVGIAGVVAVMVALLAMAEGFRQTLAGTGKPDRAIVLRSGANDEMSSGFSRDQALVISEAPGVRRGEDGKPLVAMERYLLTDVKKKGNNEPGNVPVRGVDAASLRVRPEVKIVEGRMINPGTREVLVGRNAHSEFQGLEVGGKVAVRDGDWNVVGVFTSNGDVHESELWVDLPSLQSVLRFDGYASITAQLENEAAFDTFKDALSKDPRVNVKILRQPEYYAAQSQALNTFIRVLGVVVAVIMAVGALFAALNTMYSAVSTRTVEIATLRAIGFGGGPVVMSVLIEALVLALVGGLIGGAIAYVVFNGFTVSTLNFQTFSQVAFAFKVTPALLVQGLLWAIAIGLVGGFFPALRAARLPITTALRAL